MNKTPEELFGPLIWAHDLSSRSFDLMVTDFVRLASAANGAGRGPTLEEVGSAEAARVALLRGCAQRGVRVALICLDLPRASEVLELALDLGYAVVLLGFGRRYLPRTLEASGLPELHPHASPEQIGRVLAALASQPVDREVAVREALPLSERERPSWLG